MNITAELSIEKRRISPVSEKKPMIIAGPCSAETRDQVLATALSLKDSGLEFFRAGIWKPRTRPGNFEGVGEEGLAWMVEAREMTGLKIVTEVATKAHVEAVLSAGFDAVWIGARTTANPFSVQEIAEALKGSSVTVFIKNPVNPDLDLWIGAIERIRNAGIKKVIAVHRGFSPFKPTRFRNIPSWSIPMQLMKLMPDLTVLCDPSHIAGKKELVGEVASKALSLKMNGLFIEIHIDPANARSDKAQQLTPEEFAAMSHNFALDNINELPAEQADILTSLREEIDCWDHKLLNTLRERMKTANRIGEFKSQNNFPLVQTERWSEVMASRINEGMSLGLSAEFLVGIFEQIHGESLKFQKRIGK